MLNFVFEQSVKVLFGWGSCAQTGELLTQAGYKKPFVIHDQGVKNAGIIDKILNNLENSGVKYVIYDKVLPDPPDYIVQEAYDLCNGEKCDCIIAVGGGSTMDTAKGVHILRNNPPPVLKYADPANTMKAPAGLICIPTTSGTGSELSHAAVITNTETGAKGVVVHPDLRPEYTILDPEVTAGMPRDLTAFTGLDALAHACEGCTSIVATPMSFVMQEKTVEMIYEWLPLAVNNGKDMEARSNMMIAAALGGWSLYLSLAHLGHSIAHALGTTYHMPHGSACGYSLPWVMEFIADVDTQTEKVKRIGKCLGASFKGNESAQQIGAITRDAIIKFRDDTLKCKPISEFNCDKGRLSEVADVVMKDPCCPLTPKKVEKQDVMKILEKIFA